MINYIEYGYKLHEVIAAAGHSLAQKNGIWISSDDAAVQAIIGAYDPLSNTIADSLLELSDYASELITNDNKPLIGRGRTANFRDRVFTQFDIEEASILAETDWTAIDVPAAKARLDSIV